MLIFETVVDDAARSGGCTLLAPVGPGLHLTKRYTLGADGRPMKAEDHSQVKQHFATPHDIGTPAKLLHLLRQGRTDLAFIRGAPLPHIDLSEPVFRRIHSRPGEPAYFGPCARSWLMGDWDGLEAPAGLDLTDPAAVGLHLVEKYLPLEFGVASWVLWFSASHLMPGGIIKAHQMFWLDRPVTDEEAKAWFPDDCPVDRSLFNPVQLHYCAPPLLEDGVPDPCPNRIHYEESIQATVDVPADLAERARVRPANAAARTCEEPRHGWDHPEAIKRAEQFVRGFRGVSEGEPYGGRGKAGRDNRTKELIGHLWDLGVSLEWAYPAVIEWDAWANHPPLGADRVTDIADYHYAGNAQNDPGCKFRPGSEFVAEVAAQGSSQAEEPAPGQLGEAAEIFSLINEHYAVVTNGPAFGRILCTTDPFAPVILPEARLHTALAALYRVEGGKDTKAASRAWINWRGRRNVYALEFEPTPIRVRRGAFNYWQGWRVKPCEGDAHLLLLQHLERIVCSGDRQLLEWLLAWLADLVQSPGKKPGTGVILHSHAQGTGKTIVAKAIAAMTAPYSVILSKPEHLTGRFNAALANRVFVDFEEAAFSGRVQERAILKDLLTGDNLMLEHKGVDPVPVSNHAHLMITGNLDASIPVELSDRRWAVFSLLPDCIGDIPYFARIAEAIDNGSLPACLLHFLLNHRYDPHLLRRPPMTATKGERILANLDPVHRWWSYLLGGEIGVTPSPFEVPVPKSTFYGAFQNWASGQRPFAAVDARLFWKRVRELAGPGVKETRPRSGDRERQVSFPDLTDCRARFVQQIGFDAFGGNPQLEN